MELNRCKNQEEQRLEEARLVEEPVMSAVQKERAKIEATVEAAEAAQRIAESGSRRRSNLKTMEMKKVLDTLSNSNIKYKRYTIEENEEATDGFTPSQKIGEGGYGLVYWCYLDHTSVAVRSYVQMLLKGDYNFCKRVGRWISCSLQ